MKCIRSQTKISRDSPKKLGLAVAPAPGENIRFLNQSNWQR